MAVGILVLASLAVRLYGLNWTLPYVAHPDEPVTVDAAVQMMRTGDLDPHSFVYPTLFTYLELAAFSVYFLISVLTGHFTSVADLPQITHIYTADTGLYLVGRGVTALLGAATILLVFLTGRSLYGRTTGLVAALLLAFHPLHLEHSHYITVDVPSAFFTALCLWLAAAIYAEGRTASPARWRALHVLAGVAAGLAAGTKYNAMAIVLAVVVAHVLSRPPGPQLDRGLLYTAAGMGAAFLAGTPFALVELPLFLNHVGSVVYHYKFAGHPGAEGTDNWAFYVQTLWEQWPVFVALGLAGAVWLVLRHRRADVILLVFPLPYFAVLSSYKVNFIRNLMPLLPFLALFAAIALVEVVRAPARKRVDWQPLAAGLALALALALTAWPSLQAVQAGYLMSQEDSRVTVERWVTENLPRGTFIMAEGRPELWPGHSNVSTISKVINHDIDWYRRNGYAYLVVSSDSRKAIYARREENREDYEAYEAIFSRLSRVAHFPGSAAGYQGPEIDLYATGLDAATVAIQNRVDAAVGEHLELLGYDLGKVAHPAERLEAADASTRDYHPGEVLGLTLYWHATDRAPVSQKTFLHVVNAAGQIVAQRDTIPQDGRYPTTAWRPGELVIDPTNLVLPAGLAPGRYELRLGMYQESDLRRLPIVGAPHGDYLELGAINVSAR